MARRDFDNVHQLYTQLKADREGYTSLWADISDYVGIGLDVNYTDANNSANKAKQIDELVDDPTAAISVNQAGDYILGVMWGTGDKAFDIVPSRHVTDLVDEAAVEDWYNYATQQTLFHMNHSKAGLSTSLRPYSYDQQAFGTSGVGTFLNKAFINSVDENALLFRHYGVDNMAIDEGKSGIIEFVFITYHWKVNRIVGEFATVDGVVDDQAVAKLPKPIRDAYADNDVNQEFQIVFGVMPRDDFDPKLKGRKGTRYRGVWFMDDGKVNKGNSGIFHEDSFAELPIAVCRQLKVRGEVYGRSSGTMLISSIRSVNFMVGTVIEVLEKMADPSLGMVNSSLFGDNVLDTSPKSLNIFNPAMGGGTNNPVFPIHDVGDPTGIINYLIPYLNEKITTAFKIDALLDFNSAKDMTATESLQRFAIRGKSLAGILQQQKIELLEPMVRRSISILMGVNELGINPTEDPERAKELVTRGRPERVIPDAIQQVIDEGKPWYEIRFNNELEKLGRTDSVERLLQVLNTVGAIAGIYPQILEAVDFYKLLNDINNALGDNNGVVINEQEFREKLQQQAELQAQAMQLQAQQMQAGTQKDVSQANKNNKEAVNE